MDVRIPEHAWVVEEDLSAHDVQELRRKLGAYNVARAGIDTGVTLAILLRTAQGEIVAGIYGWLWGQCLEVDYLWVHDDLRGRGVGKRLVQTLEDAAQLRGCRQIMLDTFSFQSPGFYEQLGYRVFGIIDGYAGGHQKVFLRKRLA